MDTNGIDTYDFKGVFFMLFLACLFAKGTLMSSSCI